MMTTRSQGASTAARSSIELVRRAVRRDHLDLVRDAEVGEQACDASLMTRQSSRIPVDADEGRVGGAVARSPGQARSGAGDCPAAAPRPCRRFSSARMQDAAARAS